MFPARCPVIVAAGFCLALAACSSSGTPAPSATAAPAITAGAPAGSGAVGQVKFTVGGKDYTFPAQHCSINSDGSLAVQATPDNVNSNDITLSLINGGTNPAFTGVIAGKAFGGNPATNKIMLNGNGGTFSGTDQITGGLISGSFTCG